VIGGYEKEIRALSHFVGAKESNSSRSVVTGCRSQILLQGSLQQAWMMIGLRDFFLRATEDREAVVVACGVCNEAD
jgi:hypothetical protein